MAYGTHLELWKYLFKWFEIHTVLEFGCGLYSTRIFVEYGCSVTSIEMQHKEWFDEIKQTLPTVDLRLALGAMEWGKEIATLKRRYDMIFVDGHKESRPDCMNWARQRTDLIVAHDTDHAIYGWERAQMNGWDKFVFDAVSPTTTFWVRQ